MRTAGAQGGIRRARYDCPSESRPLAVGQGWATATYKQEQTRCLPSVVQQAPRLLLLHMRCQVHRRNCISSGLTIREGGAEEGEREEDTRRESHHQAAQYRGAAAIRGQRHRPVSRPPDTPPLPGVCTRPRWIARGAEGRVSSSSTSASPSTSHPKATVGTDARAPDVARNR